MSPNPRRSDPRISGQTRVDNPPRSAVTARILELSAAVAGRIAAGEVIERPAAALKELLENSLDAGADRIDVFLEKGGAQLIEVRDDGEGVPPEDLPLAFRRHATSKTRAVEDLEAISTLGFRGEALASLSAAAQTSMTSRQREQAHGWLFAPGDDAAPAPVAAPFGTKITARNLFADLPARRRFLRTAATETAHCVVAVQRIALGRPPRRVFADNRRAPPPDPAAAPKRSRAPDRLVSRPAKQPAAGKRKRRPAGTEWRDFLPRPGRHRKKRRTILLCERALCARPRPEKGDFRFVARPLPRRRAGLGALFNHAPVCGGCERASGKVGGALCGARRDF